MVMGWQLVLLVAVLGLARGGKHDIYEGYSVHGVVLKDQKDLELLHQLEGFLDLDVWQHGAPGKRDAHVMVTPANTAAFLELLDQNGLEHYLKNGNLPRSLEQLDEELVRHRSARRNRQAIPFEDYPRYAEVEEYMERLATQYPDIVTLVTAGQSYEGRDIKYMKISTTNFEDPTKPIYFMDAMIHAREWVTTPVTLYSMHRLVEDLRSEDRDLLEGTDWIIVPIVNPDGYEYTHTDERLWRRTRSIDLNVSAVCVGVDANRNFDIDHFTVGVSSDPCSNTYPGQTPFSELETAIIRGILTEHLDRIQLYLNIHSYGNWILFGYGNGSSPDNGMALHHVGAVMGAHIDAVKLPQAAYYMVGNSALLLYATSGSAQDYAQSIGVPFSYTLELPAYSYFFQVPPSYIGQINEETWRGIAAQVRLAKLHYSHRIGILD